MSEVQKTHFADDETLKYLQELKAENKRFKDALEAIAYVDVTYESYDYLVSWCTGVAEAALQEKKE